MSKYTTQVRFICESKSGLANSTGCGKVNEVIQKSWNKIFTTDVEFFDENYRSVICSKILKHYYLREIGAETVGIWELWMNTRLEEIMPYYNELYMSAKLKFDPLHNVDLSTKHTRDVDATTGKTSKQIQKNTSERNDGYTDDNTVTSDITNTGNYNNEGGTRDLYTDTPQGSIQNLENETYLTNARRIHDQTNGTSTSKDVKNESGHASHKANSSSTDNITRDDTANETSNSMESYVETVTGNSGGSFSGLLLEFRQTLLNIDMLVIEEFDDLFMGLW